RRSTRGAVRFRRRVDAWRCVLPVRARALRPVAVAQGAGAVVRAPAAALVAAVAPLAAACAGAHRAARGGRAALPGRGGQFRRHAGAAPAAILPRWLAQPAPAPGARRPGDRGDRLRARRGQRHPARAGLTGLEVLASQLRAGWSGMRPVWHNVGRRKVQSLARHGVTAWQVAYGDSMYDVAMLKPADEAVLVNGTPKLCKKVEKALGRTIRRVDWS